MPVDVLKVERAFLDRKFETRCDSSLVEAILALGASLGLQTVAARIEREGQLEQLQALGCGFGQGYLLSRPIDRADVEVLLARQLESAARADLRRLPDGKRPSRPTSDTDVALSA